MDNCYWQPLCLSPRFKNSPDSIILAGICTKAELGSDSSDSTKTQARNVYQEQLARVLLAPFAEYDERPPLTLRQPFGLPRESPAGLPRLYTLGPSWVCHCCDLEGSFTIRCALSPTCVFCQTNPSRDSSALGAPRDGALRASVATTYRSLHTILNATTPSFTGTGFARAPLLKGGSSQLHSHHCTPTVTHPIWSFAPRSPRLPFSLVSSGAGFLDGYLHPSDLLHVFGSGIMADMLDSLRDAVVEIAGTHAWRMIDANFTTLPSFTDGRTVIPSFAGNGLLLKRGILTSNYRRAMHLLMIGALTPATVASAGQRSETPFFNYTLLFMTVYNLMQLASIPSPTLAHIAEVESGAELAVQMLKAVLTSAKWNTPKVHSLLHFGTLMRMYGCLALLSMSNFEAKHKENKRACLRVGEGDGKPAAVALPCRASCLAPCRPWQSSRSTSSLPVCRAQRLTCTAFASCPQHQRACRRALRLRSQSCRGLPPCRRLPRTCSTSAA